MDDELLAYYDEIRRLAEAKSDSREEAEDLLSETFLAAFAYRHNGGVIEHPKTYLVHTLMHKRNSLLRRKYRLPKVVSLQTLPEDAAVRGVYLITYEKIKDGARLNNISLSIESDIEIQDFALRLPGPEMETIPLTTGEVQDITLNIERIGESYQHDFDNCGLWLEGTIVREGKEHEIMGMSL